MSESKNIFKVLIIRIKSFLRRATLPGFERVSLYDVFLFFFKSLENPRFTLYAAAMSYNFFFSLFPLLILLFIILPTLPIGNLHGHILAYMGELSPLVPLDVRNLVSENMANSTAASALQGGDFWIIALNGFLALFGAIRGIIAMMKSFTKDQHVRIFRRRNILQLYSTAFIIFISLSLLGLLSVSIFVAGDFAVNYLLDTNLISKGLAVILLRSFTYLLTLLALFWSISMLYYMAPPTHQRWRFISPGSIVAGVLTLLTFIGFSFFINSVLRLDRFYGSLGTIILLMVWFYYFSIVLLVGFELNAAISVARSMPNGTRTLIPKRKRYRKVRKRKVQTSVLIKGKRLELTEVPDKPNPQD